MQEKRGVNPCLFFLAFLINLRYHAYRKSNLWRKTMSDKMNVAEIFGQNVFNDRVMKERLPKKVYKELHKTIDDGKELDPITAEVVAGAMKDWAGGKGSDPLYPLVSAADRFYGRET